MQKPYYILLIITISLFFSCKNNENSSNHSDLPYDDKVNFKSFSPNKKMHIKGKGILHNSTKLYLHINNKEEFLTEIFSQHPPEITWYSNIIIGIHTPVTSIGDMTKFYHVKKRIFSKLDSFIGAVDPINHLALAGEEKVWIQDIFKDTKKIYLAIDIIHVPYKGHFMRDSHFDKYGNLHLIYYLEDLDTKKHKTIKRATIKEKLNKKTSETINLVN